jgi:hypothetical protein
MSDTNRARHPVPPWHRNAEELDRAAAQLDLALSQETEWSSLQKRAADVAIFAARQLLDASDRGAKLLGFLAPGRGAVRLDPADDGQALRFWAVIACAILRGRSPAHRAGHAGRTDFPEAKRDTEGRLMGADGRALRWVPADADGWPLTGRALREAERRLQRVRDLSDAPPGETPAQAQRRRLALAEAERQLPLRMAWSGRPALVTDDHTAGERLAHVRKQVEDWSNACRAAAELLREEAALTTRPDRAGGHNSTPDQPSCAARNQIFLRWEEEEGLTTPAIRDRWNKEYPQAPVGEGRHGYDVVRKGLIAARKDRSQG